MVDAVDNRILSELKKDSRRSFAEIGRGIQLSPSAVRDRVLKMEDIGLIKKYSIEVDNKLLGHDIEAFILVKIFHGNLSAFLKFIKQVPEIEKAYRITGNQNIHLRVLLKDQLHLQNLIDRLMPYGDTHTLLILSQIE